MRVTELARAGGVTAETVRHYTREGLLRPQRDPRNGYQLYDEKGLGTDEQPEPGRSVGDFIGYHLRSGGHSMRAEDWAHYLRFAARHWKR